MDKYYLEKIIVVDGVTANIYRPILTEEERKAREEIVCQGIAEFGRSCFKNDKKYKGN